MSGTLNLWDIKKSNAPRCFDMQAGQYKEEKEKSRAIKEGKVVCFLRSNPLSTKEEIFAATQVRLGAISMRYLKFVMRDGKAHWRLNHINLRRDGLE